MAEIKACDISLRDISHKPFCSAEKQSTESRIGFSAVVKTDYDFGHNEHFM